MIYVEWQATKIIETLSYKFRKVTYWYSFVLCYVLLLMVFNVELLSLHDLFAICVCM